MTIEVWRVPKKNDEIWCVEKEGTKHYYRVVVDEAKEGIALIEFNGQIVLSDDLENIAWILLRTGLKVGKSKIGSIEYLEDDEDE